MKIFGINFSFGSRSSDWPKVRKQHLKKNPCCCACGRKISLDVHHIEPVHINPEKELDPDNLVTLCSSPCHLVFGHFMDYKSWNPNVIEDCETYYVRYKSRPYK